MYSHYLHTESGCFMRRYFSFLVALFLFTWPMLAFAHSGGTDSMGGHYDNSTGKYHFHHGHSAHQHENGRCPYDKSGRTDWPTAKPDRKTQTPKPYSYSSSSRYSPIVTVRPTSIPKQESDGAESDGTLQSVGIACAGAAAGGIGVSVFRKKKH